MLSMYAGLPAGSRELVMKEVHLYERAKKPPLGVALDDSASGLLICDEDTIVRKPDFSPLLILLKSRTPRQMQERILPSFRKAATEYGSLENRGSAVGRGLMTRSQKLDGSTSRTNRVNADEVEELEYSDAGIIGFTDSATRFPYCRQTVFNAREAAHFKWMEEYFQLGARLFAQYEPDRYAYQQAMAERTDPAWVIPETPFTTITVNRNWRTKVHVDKGDLQLGFGVMGVLGNSHWSGCHLLFPEWRVACELRPGDFILDDVHELHCNTPLIEGSQDYERISVVMYYRSKMIHCGSPAAEAEKKRQFIAKTPNALTYTRP